MDADDLYNEARRLSRHSIEEQREWLNDISSDIQKIPQADELFQTLINVVQMRLNSGDLVPTDDLIAILSDYSDSEEYASKSVVIAIAAITALTSQDAYQVLHTSRSFPRLLAIRDQLRKAL
jgi:hypothetical protein